MRHFHISTRATAPARRPSSGSPRHGADTATSARFRPDAVGRVPGPWPSGRPSRPRTGSCDASSAEPGCSASPGPEGACRCSRAWLRALPRPLAPQVAFPRTDAVRGLPLGHAARRRRRGYGGRPGGGTDRGSRRESAAGRSAGPVEPAVGRCPAQSQRRHHPEAAVGVGPAQVLPALPDGHRRRRTPDGSPARIHRERRQPERLPRPAANSPTLVHSRRVRVNRPGPSPRRRCPWTRGSSVTS